MNMSWLNNYWIVLRELPIAQLTRCLRKTLSQPQVTQPTKVIPDFPLNMHIRASREGIPIGPIFHSDSKKVNTASAPKFPTCFLSSPKPSLPVLCYQTQLLVCKQPIQIFSLSFIFNDGR